MNVCKRLRRRSVEECYHGDRFISASYFSSSMLAKMRVEAKYGHWLDDRPMDFDSLVTCLDWSHDGRLLIAGRRKNCLQVLHPFGESPYGRRIDLGEQSGEFVSFMPGSSNIFAVCLQKASSSNWRFLLSDYRHDHVKVFDLGRATAVRRYNFFGSAKKTCTLPFDPNAIWFNVERRKCSLGEADVREPGFRVSRFSVGKETTPSCMRDFDLSPDDNHLIAVADHSNVAVFDRRMVGEKRPPVMRLDGLFAGNESHNWYTSSVKFHPNGRELVVNYSHRYNFEHQVFLCQLGSGEGTQAKPLQVPKEVGQSTMRLKNPCFLGPSGRYLMLDLCLNSYSVVFDCDEGAYVGKLKGSDAFEVNSLPVLNFNTLSRPHPKFCLVAVADRSFVNLVAPAI